MQQEYMEHMKAMPGIKSAYNTVATGNSPLDIAWKSGLNEGNINTAYQGSKNFDIAKEFCFTQPEAAHALLQKITDTTILYLKEKVKAGVNAVQVFDSWGGMLSPVDYQEFSWQYIQQIIDALKEEIPVIAFGKGCWFALGEMAKSGASALGVDWTCSPRNARYLTGGNITLQGNFDPTRLFSPPAEIKRMVTEMINAFGKDKYIVNLGHGILPNIPLENAGAFIEAVKEYKAER